MKDLVLPAFAMDCRDWIVVTPSQLGLPDEVGGTPLLALLSSAVIGPDSFRAVNGALSIGLPDSGVTTAAVC
ncbi:MAG: hypothetical protein M3O28_05205, partial [Actinomycetota bacterium]|nr:hypothetical protein [Actinomycetota bacterium]